MATVNRFSRPMQAAKFDPRGLNDLMQVRHARQLQEDTALAETREWLKDMYNTTHTDADSTKVVETRKAYEEELDQLADEVRRNGLSRGLTNKLLNFKDKYDKEMSASGIIGGAQAYKVKEEQEKGRFYELGIKTGFSKTQLDKLWNDRAADRTAFGEDGIIKQDYEPVSMAHMIDPLKQFADMEVGRTKGQDGMYDIDTNRTQVEAAISGIYARFATEGTPEHQSMIDQGLTLEDIRERLVMAGAARVNESVDASRKHQWDMMKEQQRFRMALEGQKAAAKAAEGDVPVEPTNVFYQTAQTQIDNPSDIPKNIDEIRKERLGSKFMDQVYNIPIINKTVGTPGQTEEQAEAQRAYEAEMGRWIENYYNNHDRTGRNQFRQKYAGEGETAQQQEEFWNEVEIDYPLFSSRTLDDGISDELLALGHQAFPGSSDEDIMRRISGYKSDQDNYVNKALDYYNQDTKHTETNVQYVALNVPAEADPTLKKAIERVQIAGEAMLADPDAYEVVQEIDGDDNEMSESRREELEQLLFSGQGPDSNNKVRMVGVQASSDGPPHVRYAVWDPDQKKDVIVDVEVGGQLTSQDLINRSSGLLFSELSKLPGNEGKALFGAASDYLRYKDYEAVYGNKVSNYANSKYLKPYIKEPGFDAVLNGAEAELYKDTTDGKFRMVYKNEDEPIDVNRTVTWDKLFRNRFKSGEITRDDFVVLAGTNPDLLRGALYRLAETDQEVMDMVKMYGNVEDALNAMPQEAVITKLNSLFMDNGSITADTKAQYMKMLEGK